MQVESEKAEFMQSKLPNVTLFIVMTLAWVILMSGNYKMLTALIIGTFETNAERVFVNLALIFGTMALGGFAMHFNLKPKLKKAQLNTNKQP